jgi:sugar phosphate permease
VILAAGFLVLFFGSGSRFAFGLVLKPMSDELGWSRSTLTLGITAFMLVSAVSLPVVGRLVDRHSLRVIMGVGAVVGALGLLLMGQVREPWQLFVVYGIVYAVGNAGISNPAVGVMISRWFDRRRGIAVSAAVSGGAIGQLVIIGLLAAFLATLGWRTAFTALGIISMAVLAPVVFFAVRSHPDNLPSPDSEQHGLEAGEKDTDSSAGIVADLSLQPGTILRSRQLVLLLFIYAICGFQDFFVATHVVAFAQDQGLGTVLAGNLLAWMGLMGLVGVLLSGVLADAFGAKNPTLLCFLLRVVIFAFILFFQDTVAVAVFALLYGFTFLVTAPLTVVFAGVIFGQSRLGLVAGSISMVHQVSGGLGALAGALIFDQWGSYDRGFMVLLVMSLVAIPVTLMVRERALLQRVA